MKWIRTSVRLPPMYKRVLIWTNHSNLFGRDGAYVQSYLMQRVPIQAMGNHIVPYCYECENSGMQFAHHVTYWAEVEAPE